MLYPQIYCIHFLPRNIISNYSSYTHRISCCKLLRKCSSSMLLILCQCSFRIKGVNWLHSQSHKWSAWMVSAEPSGRNRQYLQWLLCMDWWQQKWTWASYSTKQLGNLLSLLSGTQKGPRQALILTGVWNIRQIHFWEAPPSQFTLILISFALINYRCLIQVNNELETHVTIKSIQNL